MICVDCDRVITGAYVVVAVGDSMSAARQDFHAHPGQAPDCLPRTERRRRFRRELDADLKALVGALHQSTTANSRIHQRLVQGNGVARVLPQPRIAEATPPIPPGLV
ncbi:hypothetical protein [Streptomyces sp. NPDC047939]|uniref:hypothetical protein n=1 Tax=Streptomyces sp. NPDC047939 TaxID=3155381 RepID=UPI003423E213